MTICDTCFCGKNNFLYDVVSLLDSTLFANSRQTLIERYRSMNALPSLCNVPAEFEKEYSLVCQSPAIQLNPVFQGLSSKQNLGHDLPIWVNEDYKKVPLKKLTIGSKISLQDFYEFPNVKGKTVMLVGIDPLRRGKQAGDIYISAPWGMHSPNYRSGKKVGGCSGAQARFITYIIETLIYNGANVYMTDAVKFYADGYDAVNEEQVFRDVLDKEIDFVNPDYLIPIGDITKVGRRIGNPLNGVNKKGAKLAPCFPHPNGLWLKEEYKLLIYLHLMQKTF